MKKFVAFLFTIALIYSANAQETNQKIIIDVTSTDNKVYQSVLLTVDLMSVRTPNTQIEVFAYGEAVPMFMKNQSIIADKIAKHIANKNIIFTACEISMELFNIQKNQLLDGVGTVGNAVEDIVNKQGEGWGYIKAGN